MMGIIMMVGNEYITYGGIPIVVLADTDEQKMALLDNLFKETYIVTLPLETRSEM